MSDRGGGGGGGGGALPQLFAIESLVDFHTSLERELDNFLEGIDAVPGIRGRPYAEDNAADFEAVRRRALTVAAQAYLGDHADHEAVAALARGYPEGGDLKHAVRTLEELAAPPPATAAATGHASPSVPPRQGLSALQRKTLEAYTGVVRAYIGTPFVHPRAVQLSRLRAVLDAAQAAAPQVPPADEEEEEEEEAEADVAGASAEEHQAKLRRCAEGVAAAMERRRVLAEQRAQNDALAATADDYAGVAREAGTYSELCQRAAEVVAQLGARGPAGLCAAHEEACGAADALSREVATLRTQAHETLEGIIAQYRSLQDTVDRMTAAARECRVAAAEAAHKGEELSDYAGLVRAEADRQLAAAEGAAASGRLAEASAGFLREFAQVTGLQLQHGAEAADRRVAQAQGTLHHAAELYFSLLKTHEDREMGISAVVEQKMQMMNIRHVDPSVSAALVDERVAADHKLQYIGNEILNIRTLLEANGVVDAMRRRRQETFLDHYDRETRGNESKAFFAVVLTRLKECSEYIAELTDTPQHRASQQSFVRQAVEGGLRALYAVLLASADTNAALAHAKALNADEAGALTSKVKRHVRTAAMNFTELNQAHPLLVKTDGTPYALPDGGTAACLFQLATPVFAALEACVRVLASVASGDATAGTAAEDPGAAAPSASNAAFSPPNPVSPEFATVSPRLRVKRSGTDGKCTVLQKPLGGRDHSDGSARCSPGFDRGSGVVSWSVRLLRGAENLMVGVSDQALNVGGYLNCMHHHRAYFLNVTNGTLWAPALQHEGSAYWPEPLDADGSILTCILDMDSATLAFAFNGRDLGVAFVGLRTETALYPAFEVYACGTEIELLPA